MGYAILVVGGADDVGSCVAENLARSEEVERVTIADVHWERASRVARSLDGMGPRVDAVGVDAADHDGLLDAIRGYDVVASTAGPFFRLEPMLVRACVESGVDYISVCDEWAPTEQVSEEFHGRARERDCIVVTGMGASPGLTNLAVSFLAARLDEAIRAEIAVFQPFDAGGGAAVIEHLLFILSGRPPVWRDGERKPVPPCWERREQVFPRYGRAAVWNMGHSEPVALPRALPSLREVSFWMGFGFGSRLLTWPARFGLFSSEIFRRAALRAVEAAARGSSAGAAPSPGAVRVDVWGRRDGNPAHEMLCGTGDMRTTTGIALSTGCLMLARGELSIARGGVYAPEECFDPELVLSRADANGIGSYRDPELKQPVRFAPNRAPRTPRGRAGARV